MTAMTISPGTETRIYPLSAFQNRIWFMENFNSDIRAYSMPLEFVVTGDLDQDVLTRGIDRIIARHESLRTVFPKVNGLPVQKILPEFHANIQVTQAGTGSQVNADSMISARTKANSSYKFDIENGPLFRFELLVMGNNRYIFLVNFHQLIADMASVRIFFRELATEYQSISEHKSSGLPKAGQSYSDFTIRQNQWLDGEDSRVQTDYWKKELSGIPDALQLPLDFHRPKIQTYNGSGYHFDIDEDLRERLVQLSHRQGTSLAVTLLAAFGSLLSRYSLQDDLVIGMPVSVRNDFETDSLFGRLVNFLPLRFTTREDLSFSDAVEFTRKKYTDATRNQDVPFERIVDELKIRRAMDKSPVFQVLYNFHDDNPGEIRLPGLTFELKVHEPDSVLYDLNLILNDDGKIIRCVIEFNTDLFRTETIMRFAEHWITFLDSVSSAGDLPVAEINFLTGKEKNQLLVEWNRTDAEYPNDRCIHEVFEEQVRRTPDSIAVEYENERLSYSELNSRANRLAGYLIESGVSQGSVVAFCLDRGFGLLTGMLAISKAGATYLPLNTMYPKARLGMILEDAKPVMILTQSSLRERLPETNATIILEDDPKVMEHKDNGNPGLGRAGDPAYILYTSGSTGKPKGVPVKHYSVVNLINSFGKLLAVRPEDVLLAVTTISFDIAELELYLPLFNGAKVVIGTEETAMDTDLLMKKLAETRATIFQATPVTFKMLVRNSWSGKADLKAISGGEALSKELVRDLIPLCREIWNAYGPTETTIYSVVAKISPRDTGGEGYVPIGRPVDNTKVYVLNKKMIPVPIGHVGELYIGGDGVSSGYLNLPEMNKERFCPDPFTGDPDSRLYKTGDNVYYNPDGSLVFLERADSQVKIRGFRIELGEVESVIAQYPDIKETVVIAREDHSGEKSMVAYYIMKDSRDIDHQDLRKFLAERLPDYMVPNFYIRMEQFPLTPSLKVDRKALPEPGRVPDQVSRNYVAPVTPTEKKLAGIWMSLLKLDKVSIHDNFFEVGGHSMIAVSMMTKIEKEFGIRLPLATLFEQSTIHTIAKVIDEGAESLRWRPLVPIRPTGSRKPIFLVHGMGLNVLLYTTVVKYMDPAVPVYGLQAKGMNGKEEPLGTIEEIAKYYISEIMTIDKEGPYAMAGFSLGGKIAYEMAIQLKKMGKEVRFLGMFDTSVDDPVADLPYLQKTRARIRHLIRYTNWNILHFFTANDESTLTIIKRRINGLQRKITGLDFRIDKIDMISTGAMKELPRYLKKVHRANVRADRKYIVRPYDGSIHVFKAQKQTFYISDPVYYGWGKFATGGVILHEIPGEHSTTFAPPNDRIFASVLQDSLDKCEQMGTKDTDSDVKISFNSTVNEYRDDQTVFELFEEQAARQPGKTAIIQDERSITFGELNLKANHVAALLREKGIRPDQVTGILMDQSIEFIVAVLGVLKAGGAYLPIDPGYPEDRIGYILENSGAERIITRETFNKNYKGSGRDVILINDYRTLRDESNNPAKVNSPSDLVYIIYTSGSTGKPKGVMVTHQGLMNYISWAEKVYLEGEKLDFPLFTSVSFDLTITSIFTPLVTGNTIIVYAGDDKLSLVDRVVKDNLSGIVKLTPTHLAMIAEMDVSGSSIRKIIVGGEDLKSALAEKIHSKFRGKVRIFNEYGPTETVVGCMIHEYDPRTDRRPSVPIGVPADNVRIYLLDQEMKPVPDGEPGEIYIAGDGVARGYLNNPELTKERFPDDLFFPGKRMYKTGDLGRTIPSGELEFLGRADFQVKIRGYRIEPGEIESTLSQFEGITGNAVIAREDTPGNQILVAYFTAQDHHGQDEEEIRRFLMKKLPEYMVPSVFVRLDKFPLTSNHKIDRKALPKPEIVAGLTPDHPAALTPTEIRISALWDEVLGYHIAGIHANFFQSGGHSLTAAQLILRIRRVFGIEIPLRLIFEKPTIQELGEFIDAGSAGRVSDTKQKRVILPVKIKGNEYPLSSIQNRIWFMENLDRSARAYNIPLDYRITGNLRLRILKKAIGRLIERHDALRTTFKTVNSFPVQKIHEKSEINLTVTDLVKQPAGSLQEIIRKHSSDNASFQFDLENGPLYRFELLVLGKDEFIFLANFHHLISDASSVDIIFRELFSIYHSLISGDKSTLQPVPVTYADFSVWQGKWLESEECRSQIEFWKKELINIPEALRLPVDFPRPRVQTYNGTEYHFRIESSLREKIFALCARHGTSMPVVLMAAYGVLLYRYSSQDDFVIGMPVSTRDPDQQASTVGALINTLPLHFTVSAGMKFSEFVEQAKQIFFPALENRDVPFEKLVEGLKISRTTDTSPVFQVLFNYLVNYREDLNQPGLSFRMIDGERVSAQFDLNLIVNDRGGKLDCIIEFNTDLFKKETIERFAGHWLTLLESACNEENQALNMIPILTDMEKKKMLDDWNQTGTEYPSDCCIHQVFERQVKLTPDAIAVEFEDQKLTYAELNARADDLASLLVKHGAGEGKIVAVFLERGIDLVAGLLAVSKTGGTYLPLDPVFPKARLELILEDAEPLLVLTQKSLAELLPGTDASILLTDDPGIQGSGKEFHEISSGPWNPAYILYTSGSTGKPKGVMVKQKSVVNLVNAFSKLLEVKKEDTLLAVTTVLFDIAELEIFLPLFNGARLVIASQETSMDPHLLIRKMEESNTTIFQATPVTFKMLTGNSWKGSPGMRLLCGGEAFSKELARELLPLCREVWNVYGPTETTIWSVAKKVMPEDVTGEGYVPIGRPLDNTRVYVLNSNHVPVPAGIPGELYIGGDGVSPGYHKLPEMTAERFIPDTFSKGDTSALYKTGDLVKYQPDGNLVFLERADSQVKIRGFRIELGEIESVLKKHEMIRESVVVVREVTPEEKILVAYFITKDGQVPDTQELRQFLGKLLPDYMIPSSFVRMEQFPLTANNKIDKKALPEPMPEKLNDAGTYEAPTTPTQKKLADIWAALLKVERVGIRDNFFDVGGHSMVAVSLMLRIEKEFGVRLTLGNLFDQSTIFHHAQLIDEKLKMMDGKPVMEVQSLKISGPPSNGGKKNIIRKLFKHQ